MKYCILTSSYPVNRHDSRNTGVFIYQFAKLLSARAEVLVITPDKSGQKDNAPEVPVHFFKTLGDTTELVGLNPGNPLDLLKLVSVLILGSFSSLARIKKFKPGLVIACWAVPSGMFALLAKKFFGTPYAVWALGSDIWKVEKYPFGKLILKAVLRNAKKIYGNSNFVTKRMKQYTDRKVEILHTARSLSLRVAPASLDKSKKNFACIGRFHPDKGQDILINSFSEVVSRYPEARLYLFGGGILEQALRARIAEKRLEQFVFLEGYADESKIAAYLQACDALIIPSRKESLPLVFSEALQNDCPLIVTDTCDMGELCRSYNFGLVAVPGSVSSLRDRILEFCANPLPRVAQSELKEIFNIEKIVEKFIITAGNGK